MGIRGSHKLESFYMCYKNRQFETCLQRFQSLIGLRPILCHCGAKEPRGRKRLPQAKILTKAYDLSLSKLKTKILKIYDEFLLNVKKIYYLRALLKSIFF